MGRHQQRTGRKQQLVLVENVFLTIHGSHNISSDSWLRHLDSRSPYHRREDSFGEQQGLERHRYQLGERTLTALAADATKNVFAVLRRPKKPHRE